MGWIRMPAFVNGQILTAESMNRLRVNSEYLFSLEPYAAPMFRVVDCWAESASNRECAYWQMRHWSANFKSAVEVMSVVGGAGSYKIQIHNGTTWIDAVTRAALAVSTTKLEDTVDLTSATYAALSKGHVYQVRIVATNCHLRVHRLYHYGILPASKGGYDWGTMTGGATPPVADWNLYITRLEYLRDQLGGPWAPIHQREYPAEPQGGYPARFSFQHRAAGARFAYQAGGKGKDENTQTASGSSWGPAIESGGFNTIGTLGATFYNAEVVIPDISRAMISENRHIPITPVAGGVTYTVGNWYTLVFGCRVGGAGTSKIDGWVAVVAEIGGTPDATGWQVVGEFIGGVTGADVVNNTAGGKFDKFDDNLALLKTRIDNYPHMLYEHQVQAQGNGGGAPSDFALTATKEQHFFRRGDVVAWRGVNVELLYSTKRIPIDANPVHQKVDLGTSAAGGTAESFLDLNSLPDLPHEGDYVLEAKRAGSSLTWAFELL